MDRFQCMQVFVAVVEEEGFAAAARRLQMSPPAVTRAVSALESQLGVKLLNRTTRHVRPTKVGERYADDARAVLSQLESANEAAAGTNAESRGHIAITAPVLFGRLYVMPAIVKYLRRYPQTEVDAFFLDRIVNLIEEGIDVGVRIGQLADSSMRALPVGAVRRVAVASPEYLATHGAPRVPTDLSGHTLIMSSAGNNAVVWRYDDYPGLRFKPRLRVTTNDGAIAAALEGFGITRLISYQVAPEIQSGRLQVVLPEFEPPPWPISIVHREGRLASAKVRTLIDMLADELRANPALK